MDNTVAAKTILTSKKLPTLPGIAIKLLEAVKKKEPDLREIADIIAMDPPLSMEVLKLINSPFYGLPTKISSVYHAAQMLGLKTVQNLSLSFSVIKSFKSKHPEFYYTSFWKNSLRAAIASKLIAAKLRPEFTEDAFFLGLLHNIGVLALMECFPRNYQIILHATRDRQTSYLEAENRTMGFNHMQVGQLLTKTWGLPEHIYMPIGHHHHPDDIDNASGQIRQYTQILHLATLFVDFFEAPDPARVMGVIEHTLAAWKMTDRIAADEICTRIVEQSEAVFPIFGVTLDTRTDYYKLIEQAREELADISRYFVDQSLQQRRRIELLQRQVLTDGLTGLHNYQSFHEKLNDEISRAERYRKPLSLILGDLDHFKSVNDLHGHLAGDKAIKEVAACLKNRLRESDFIARYGGEEFAIILPETPLENAMVTAERLRRDIVRLQINYKNQLITVSMSFGTHSLDEWETASKSEMLEKTDQALYRAKKAGRNRCRTYPDPGLDIN
ncbi:MAG: sensor domain-containing diguanylate cyclase [Thermodesulfobacteriota bacterium]